MSNRFKIADLHLGHRGMVKFAGVDGGPLRPWGRVDPDMSDEEADERVAEMDETIVERWNATVGPKDIVDVLGDVVINRRALTTLSRLNGRKRLRMGNHEVFVKNWNADYRPYFEEITAYKVYPDHGIIASHIPVHPCQLERRWIGNVHGHLHDKKVMISLPEAFRNQLVSYPVDPEDWGASEVPDPRYLCVSAEQTDYRPKPFDEIIQHFDRLK
jgi:calcineurin-like phosphoesterase family protein